MAEHLAAERVDVTPARIAELEAELARLRAVVEADAMIMAKHDGAVALAKHRQREAEKLASDQHEVLTAMKRERDDALAEVARLKTPAVALAEAERLLRPAAHDQRRVVYVLWGRDNGRGLVTLSPFSGDDVYGETLAEAHAKLTEGTRNG